MNAARRVAACSVVLGVIAVGCSSGSVHGRSAADSSGVVSLSPSAPASSAAKSLASPPASAQATPSSSGPILDPAAGTAAALAKDHWSTLPAAPITARTEMASAWTGLQLLIWGGALGPQGDQLAGDGAAYDPTTKQWTKLPAAPISARSGMASVWTGTELFIWGGDTAGGTSKNGALYNPTTRQWRTLPASPLSPRDGAQAVWVDNEVIVISGAPEDSSASQQVHTDLAAFNPTTNKWTTLSAMPLTANQEVLSVVAVADNDRLYAWEEWQHPVNNADGSGTIYSGIDLYIFDPTRNTWAPDAAASRPSDGLDKNNAPNGLNSTLDMGTRILVPFAQSWCGLCPGPAGIPGPATVFDPTTNSWTKLPAGPVDNLGPTNYVWTGSALIAFDTGATINGPGVDVVQGQAAVWDSPTGKWTRLPAAPLFGASVAAWDGDELLAWGMLYAPSDTGGVSSDTTGLQFGP
jgi:hypothetical protein